MPVKTNNGQYPATLRLDRQGFSKTFRDASELTAFLVEEREAWEQNNQKHGLVVPDQSHMRFLSALTRPAFDQAVQLVNDPEEALRYLEHAGAIPTESRIGKELRRILEQAPRLYPGAVAAAAAIVGRQEPWPDQGGRYGLPWPVWLSGLGGLFELVESRRSTKGAADELAAVIAEAETHTSDTDRTRIQFETWQAEAKQELNRRLAVFEEEHSSKVANADLALGKALSSYELRIADAEERVRKRLILEAPTTYWNRKARWHTGAAVVFGVIFLATLVSGIYWLTHQGVDLVGSAYERIVKDRSDPGLLALVPLAFITLPTLAFAWLLRHVSRVIVQNLSLGADARLRGTIATTYGALTSERDATPAELAIALHALFRPIDGSSHSEIAPPNLQEILELAKK